MGGDDVPAQNGKNKAGKTDCNLLHRDRLLIPEVTHIYVACLSCLMGLGFWFLTWVSGALGIPLDTSLQDPSWRSVSQPLDDGRNSPVPYRLACFHKFVFFCHFFPKKGLTVLGVGPITRLHRRGAAPTRRRRGLGGSGLRPLSSLTL